VSELRVRVRAELATSRDRLARQCEDFVDRYPFSVHAPKAMYLAGRALSTQVDEPALRVGLVKYRADHLRDTLPVGRMWRRLRKDYPDSHQAALAEWYMAVLAVRQNKMPEAGEHAAAAVAGLTRVLRALPAGRALPKGGLLPADPMPDAGEYRLAMAEAQKLAWQMRENGVGSDPAAARALADLYDANPHVPNLADRLAGLAAKHAATPLADNLRLAAAAARADPARRAEALGALSAGRPLTDAGIEACWELAWLAVRSAGPDGASAASRERAAEYFRLVATGRDSPWKARAAEQRQRLAPTTQPKGSP